jgi:hypothetical protein
VHGVHRVGSASLLSWLVVMLQPLRASAPLEPYQHFLLLPQICTAQVKTLFQNCVIFELFERSFNKFEQNNENISVVGTFTSADGDRSGRR